MTAKPTTPIATAQMASVTSWALFDSGYKNEPPIRQMR